MRDKDQQKQSASRHGPAFWKEEKERGNLGLKLMSKMGWQEGQGLGKDGKGNTEILKAKKKTNFSGVGLSKDDPFSVAQAMFSNVLAKLQPVVAGTEVDTPVAKEEEPAYNSTKAVTAFVARQGLYGRFKKAKDAKNYSSSHMAEILGKKEVKETAPTTTETEFKSDIFVKTSNVSMRDYFANKIKTSSKKVTKFQTASGGGFSLDFQADYYDQMMDKSIHGKKGLGFSQNSGKELKGSGSRVTLTNGDSHTTSISTTSFLLSPEDSKVDHNDEQPERRGLGLGFQPSSDASPMASDVTPTPPQTSSEIIVDSNKSKKKKKSKKDESKEETKVSENTLSVTPELEKPKKQKKNKKSKTNSVAPVVDGTVTSAPVPIGDSQVSSKKKKKKKEVNGLASVPETAAVETPKSLKKRKREQQVLEEASPTSVVIKKKKKDKKNKLPTSTDSTSTPITTTTISAAPVEVETKTLKKKKSKKSSQSTETTTTVVEVPETTTKKKKSKKLKTVENLSNTLSAVSSVAISSTTVSSVETVKMKKKRKKDSVSAIPDTTPVSNTVIVVEPVQKKKKSKKEKIVEQQPIVTPPTEVVKKKKKKTKVQNAA